MTCSPLKTMSTSALQSLAVCEGEDAGIPPFSARILKRSGLISYPFTVHPSSSRWPAIPIPIVPNPITPIVSFILDTSFMITILKYFQIYVNNISIKGV